MHAIQFGSAGVFICASNRQKFATPPPPPLQTPLSSHRQRFSQAYLVATWATA